MVNYKNGKIYKIVSSYTDMVYIGSTTKKYLSDRFYYHNHKCRRWLQNVDYYLSSFSLLLYGDDRIVLLENVSCSSKNELQAREQYWIEYYSEKSVNMYNAQGRSKIKKMQADKDYRHRNKARLRQKGREYYYKNKQKSLQYYKNNQESILKKKHEYYLKNKDKILQRSKDNYLKKKNRNNVE